MKKHAIALLGLGLLTLTLITAVMVAAQTSTHTLSGLPVPLATHAKDVDAETVRALDNIFESIDYHWPPAGQQSVPALMLNELPNDFGKVLDVDKRRELFLRALLPIVLIENQRLREQRELVSWLLEDGLPIDGSPMRIG